MHVDCPHCRQTFELLAEQLLAGRIGIGENVLIEVHRASDGRLLERMRLHNLVVDAGLNLLRDLMDATLTAISHFRVGTDGTAPANGQTDLLAAVYNNVVTQRVKTAFSITHRCFLPSTAANGNDLREACLANAPTSGTMFSRVTHDLIMKSISNTVTYSWTHTLSRL